MRGAPQWPNISTQSPTALTTFELIIPNKTAWTKFMACRYRHSSGPTLHTRVAGSGSTETHGHRVIDDAHGIQPNSVGASGTASLSMGPSSLRTTIWLWGGP